MNGSSSGKERARRGEASEREETPKNMLRIRRPKNTDHWQLLCRRCCFGGWCVVSLAAPRYLIIASAFPHDLRVRRYLWEVTESLCGMHYILPSLTQSVRRKTIGKEEFNETGNQSSTNCYFGEERTNALCNGHGHRWMWQFKLPREII